MTSSSTYKPGDPFPVPAWSRGWMVLRLEWLALPSDFMAFAIKVLKERGFTDVVTDAAYEDWVELWDIWTAGL